MCLTAHGRQLAMRTVRALVPFEATAALRGRNDSVVAPPTVCSSEARRGGSASTARSSTLRSGRRRRAAQLAALLEVVVSREACDTRNALESLRLKWATV